MYDPEQCDNGQGMGMGLRMYLGPTSGRPGETVTPDPDDHIAGPPTVIRDAPVITQPDTPPPTHSCNNVYPETCPGNGIWSYNIWEHHNSGGTWTRENIHKTKAGAYVAGKVMNDGSLAACLAKYSASDFQGGSSYPSGMSSKPNGQQFFDDLYTGTNRSGCRTCAGPNGLNNSGTWASRSGGADDHEGDVEYFLMYSSGDTVLAASTVPGNYIRFNKNHSYYNGAGSPAPSTIASNMMHEYSHSVDYGHCYNCSGRSTAYPYRLGSCVRSAGLKYDTEARALFPYGGW